MKTRQLWFTDDVGLLHVKIDTLNDLLVGFFFIRSIDMFKVVLPVSMLNGRCWRVVDVGECN
jgi:hypothetical protein